ncbi:hypothetical protein O0544_23355 [Edwardsiella anguillarum]|nr:hypothetical protein [Edwardsiella anguillarum]
MAEVLAWVYQLKRWRLEGAGPEKPANLPVPPALDFGVTDSEEGTPIDG